MCDLSQEDLEELLQWEAEAGGQPAPTGAEMARLCAAAIGHRGKPKEERGEDLNPQDAMAQARLSVEEWEQEQTAAGGQPVQQVAREQSVSGSSIQAQ